MIAIMSLIEALKRLAPAERRYAAGEHLFHQGDRVAVLHLLVEGRVQLVRHQAGGSALVLQRAGPGAIVAEASMVSDRYHCDAVATAPIRSLVVRKASIRARIASDPDFARAFVARLAREVQASRSRAEILSLRTVAARLDAWIAATATCRRGNGRPWRTRSARARNALPRDGDATPGTTPRRR